MHNIKHINLNYFINVFIIIFISQIKCYSQVSKPDTISAYKIDYSINLDGVLDDECWSKSQLISNFTQRELINGQPVTEKTHAAIVYNSNNLYIGIWCYDSEPEKITAKYFKRDFSYWFDDNF